MGMVYRPGDIPDADAPPPAGLALGDSWFWHGEQTLLHTLVEHPRIRPGHACIRLLGFNGARLSEYIGDGPYADVIRTHLAPDFRFTEVYLSGFANDALEHRLALRDDCSGIDDPARCFAPERLELLLCDIGAGLDGIVHAIRWAYRKTSLQQAIFLNGYDYPVPDGRGFVHSHRGWLTTMMDEARMDPDLGFRTAFMRRLIDAVNEEVLAPCHAPLERVFHVDSRGTLATAAPHYREDWDNELYPSAAGFTRLLEGAWFPALRRFGIVD